MNKIYSFRFPVELIEQIDVWAKENDINRTEQILKMLNWAIQTKKEQQNERV